MNTNPSKSLEERIAEAVREEVKIVKYNPQWIKLFEDEAEFLYGHLPSSIIKRIEHFGSTAIPGLSAKPIIDILVEVSSLDETKQFVVPALTKLGYDYFWRPEFEPDNSPYYAWFIKRNSEGKRIHHIHMVEKDSSLWDRLYFKNYLIEFQEIAKEYESLKLYLAEKFSEDRINYTKAKSEFILSTTTRAKTYYLSK